MKLPEQQKLVKRTLLKHGEVGRVDREQVQIRRELGDQPDQGIVDGRVAVAVPTGELALLRGRKEELQKEKTKTKLTT